MDDNLIYYSTMKVAAEPAPYQGEPGMAVRLPDGTSTWVPEKLFCDMARQSGDLTFGHALLVLKEGRRVARAGWNGRGMYLELQVPDEHSKMTLPYIYMKTVQGDLVPWLASQTDMLAEDWGVVLLD